MQATTIYYLMRGGVSLFYNMWLTVTLLYHSTLITDDPLKLVLLGVILEGTTFLFEIPTGVVADSYSRKWSVIVGLLLSGAAFMLEGAFTLYETVLIAQFLWGLGFTFYSGANDAWLADEIGVESASSVFIRGSQLSIVTGQVGILSAILIGQGGLQLALLSAGIGQIIIALMLVVIMPETGFTPEPSDDPRPLAQLGQTFRRSVRVLQVSPHLVTVVVVGVIVGLSVGGYDRLFTPHFLFNFDPPLEPVVWFGLLSAVVSLSSAVIMEWLRRKSRHMAADRVPLSIAVLYGGTILGNIVFVLAGQFWLAVVAFWFSQMMRTTTRPLIIVWVNYLAETRTRATAISMYWQSNALGQIIGAPVIGVIGSVMSLRVALMAAVLALSPTLWLLARARPPQSTVETKD